jgi:CBS domain-containing protein
MLVKECMTTNVQMGTPNMTLFEVAKKMRDGNFGMLPIADNEKLVGMITDRDITIRAIAEGKDAKQTNAQEIMTAQVLYCYDDQTLEDVSNNLGENQIRRLPVLNRQKRLVGILSLGDLATSDANDKKVEEALTLISKKAKQDENFNRL